VGASIRGFCAGEDEDCVTADGWPSPADVPEEPLLVAHALEISPEIRREI
jgi:hypothetical protein